MPLFDRYIAVDWSANNQPKTGSDSIWSCCRGHDGVGPSTKNHPTRHHAHAWLLAQLTVAVRSGERILVGFDFPYGYSAGFADALGADGPDPPWQRVWGYLDRHIRDDERNLSNRFEVAAEMNRRLGRHATFWGRPSHLDLPGLSARKDVSYGGDGLSEWRRVERHMRALGERPHTAWQLAGAGAVGGQSLVGIPVVRRLRDHPALRQVSRVWPFEVVVPDALAGSPAIVHAEIWPSLVAYAEEPGSCRDEQQVRAVVEHLRTLDAAGRLADLFAAAPDEQAVRCEEGWVLGAPPER